MGCGVSGVLLAFGVWGVGFGVYGCWLRGNDAYKCMLGFFLLGILTTPTKSFPASPISNEGLASYDMMTRTVALVIVDPLENEPLKEPQG